MRYTEQAISVFHPSLRSFFYRSSTIVDKTTPEAFSFCSIQKKIILYQQLITENVCPASNGTNAVFQACTLNIYAIFVISSQGNVISTQALIFLTLPLCF